MDLKIKKEFLEYSIGGGKLKVVKLKNLPVSKYKTYYDMGFSKFFTVIKKVITFDTGADALAVIQNENKDLDNDIIK